MAKLAKPGPMPILDTGETPTLGTSKANSLVNDGTTSKGKPKARGVFGGGGTLKMAKKKTGPKGAKKPAAAPLPGFKPSMSKGPLGAGNMAADTKKYGAMMKGK